MKQYGEGVKLYDDDYWGRVKESYRVYHPKSIFYSDEKILSMAKELREYRESGKTARSNSELWNMHYICKGNLHPETGQPVNRLFRWSNFVVTNIPLIMGISVLPPTTFNQIFFQSLNQSYNFGNNVSNASSSNQKSTNELAISYVAAITSAVAGSAGLRSFLLKRNFQGPVGRSLVALTPLFGIVFASSVNLTFSRSKELLNGIPVNHPKTDLKIEGLVSRRAARQAFLDSWMIRMLIPIPLVLLPMFTQRWASRHLKVYQRTVPKFFIDASVVAFSLWGSLIFVISGFSNDGYRKLGDFEPHVKAALKEFPEDTLIKFSKGL